MRFDGKTNRQRLTKIRMREYSAVTSPAHGDGARVLLMKAGTDGAKPKPKKNGDAPMAKGSALLLTSSEAGHQHILRIWDDERGGETGSSVIEIEGVGPSWHDHGWIINAEGEIEIGEVLDHAHTVNPDAVMAAILSFMKGGGAAHQQPKPFGKGKESTMPKKPDPSTPDVATLQKNLDRANLVGALSPAHFGFWKTLEGDEAGSFLTGTESSRDLQVTEFEKKKSDADPVLYKGTDGTEYRQSESTLAKFARRDDEREVELAKIRSESETSGFEKRAGEELPHLPGTLEVRGRLLKAISLIDDEAIRGNAYLIVKAKSNGMAKAFDKMGHTGQDGDNVWDGEPNQDADDQLEALAKKHAEKDETSIEVAMVKVLDTEEGRALYQKGHPADL